MQNVGLVRSPTTLSDVPSIPSTMSGRKRLLEYFQGFLVNIVNMDFEGVFALKKRKERLGMQRPRNICVDTQGCKTFTMSRASS